jgi:formylglycine-generating enzyme required for sulfatase activity
MHGNVWEWVQDIYHSIYNGAPTDGSAWEEHGAQKVCRGGSCISYARDCRSTNRYQSGQNFRFFDLGFRLVRLASTMLEQQ